jgi:hypothetical protein
MYSQDLPRNKAKIVPIVGHQQCTRKIAKLGLRGDRRIARKIATATPDSKVMGRSWSDSIRLDRLRYKYYGIHLWLLNGDPNLFLSLTFFVFLFYYLCCYSAVVVHLSLFNVKEIEEIAQILVMGFPMTNST